MPELRQRIPTELMWVEPVRRPHITVLLRLLAGLYRWQREDSEKRPTP
ncbi:hypothetical protein [Nocardia wallacei]|nr:hypothetical protein [Nocardia wallacei]